MKISLYPTAEGCLRPAEVLIRTRLILAQGKKIAVSSGDPAFDGLEGGAVLVRRVGKAFNAFHAIRPAVAIVDALDFTDPAGEELLSLQEMPHNPPVQVAGHQFRKMLDLLEERAGTEEVMLVSCNDAISGAWQEKLASWGVSIRWDLAKSTPWRTWSVTSFGRQVPADLFPVPEDGESSICAGIRSPQSHLLLALAAEHSDIHHRDGHAPIITSTTTAEGPVRLLNRLMAGKPITERIRLCRELEEDFSYLANFVRHYLQRLQGTDGAKAAGTANASGQSVPASVHPVGRRKLH